MSYRRYDFSNIGENEVSRLHPHPLNDKIYGSSEPDADLQKSVEEHGVMNPIVINRKKEILSGTRRWLAAKTAGYKKIPVLILLESESDLLSELFLIESNRARIKTPEQQAREFSELKRIESELAKLRQATSTGGSEPQLKADLPEPAGQARDIAAARVGLKPRTAEKLEKIVHAADAGDQDARRDLDQINQTGRGVDPAFRRLTSEQPAEYPKSRTRLLREEFAATSGLHDGRGFVLKAGEGEGGNTGMDRYNLMLLGLTPKQVRVVGEAIGEAIFGAQERWFRPDQSTVPVSPDVAEPVPAPPEPPKKSIQSKSTDWKHHAGFIQKADADELYKTMLDRPEWQPHRTDGSTASAIYYGLSYASEGSGARNGEIPEIPSFLRIIADQIAVKVGMPVNYIQCHKYGPDCEVVAHHDPKEMIVPMLVLGQERTFRVGGQILGKNGKPFPPMASQASMKNGLHVPEEEILLKHGSLLVFNGGRTFHSMLPAGDDTKFNPNGLDWRISILFRWTTPAMRQFGTRGAIEHHSLEQYEAAKTAFRARLAGGAL